MSIWTATTIHSASWYQMLRSKNTNNNISLVPPWHDIVPNHVHVRTTMYLGSSHKGYYDIQAWRVGISFNPVDQTIILANLCVAVQILSHKTCWSTQPYREFIVPSSWLFQLNYQLSSCHSDEGQLFIPHKCAAQMQCMSKLMQIQSRLLIEL